MFLSYSFLSKGLIKNDTLQDLSYLFFEFSIEEGGHCLWLLNWVHVRDPFFDLFECQSAHMRLETSHFNILDLVKATREGV